MQEKSSSGAKAGRSVADKSLSGHFTAVIVLIGCLIVAGMVTAAVVGVWASLRQERAAASRLLLASSQLIEQGVTRAFESVQVALTVLGQRSVRELARENGTVSASSASLVEAMRYSPHIRQLVLVDATGKILADSASGDVVAKTEPLWVNLAAIGFGAETPRSMEGTFRVGTSVPGRFLKGVPGGKPSGELPVSSGESGLTVLPVGMYFTDAQGHGLWALAALNPVFFQDSFDAILSQDRAGTATQAFMIRYDGVPLVSLPQKLEGISQFSAELLSSIHANEGNVLETALPGITEAGARESIGLLRGASGSGVLSWRVSSRYPLVVLVGLSDADLMVRWWDSQGGLMGGGLMVLAVMIALTVLLVVQVVLRARLQDQVRVLSQAIDQGPTAVVITDGHGRIEYVNRAFSKMLGYSSQEVHGQTPRCIKSGLMDGAVYQDLWKTITRGQVWNGEMLNRTAEGDLRWMSTAISAVQNEDGVISHYVAVETDVTERKQVQKRLAEMQQLAEGLLKLPVVLYRLNAQGILTDVLGNGLARIGVDRLELIGQPFTRVFELADSFDEQALAGRSVRFESTLRSGPRVFYLDHLLAPDNSPLSEQEEIARKGGGAGVVRRGAIGFALDVTARREAEDRLSSMVDRLDASNHELEQFAYVASHDLQEPLRQVSSYMSLLRRRYAGKLDRDADEFIDYAVDGARRMQSLILDLLQLSRVGTQGKEPEPVDTHAVIETALANLALAVEDCKAIVTVHPPIPTVMGDAAQLVRLFQNLVGNALKYRRPDVTPQVSITCGAQGNLWQFVIADNGQGIDPGSYERIFMIFQRLHTREEAEGNGIGLAVCRKIVERHGGKIWVESVVGEGSRFCFTLPSARSESQWSNRSSSGMSSS